MKKFFSLVLALVMALSLTTVAWGADPVQAAQDALDTATNGTVIQLEEDVNYGTLYIRANVGVDNNAAVATNANTEKVDYFTTKYPKGEFVRNVVNVTIKGAEGATVDAIKFESGTFKVDGLSGTMYRFVNIENLVIDGVEFTDATNIAASTGFVSPIFIDLQSVNVNGLTVQNCTLEGNKGNMNFVYAYGKAASDCTFVPSLKNISLIDNTVSGIARLCELREAENVTIEGNTANNLTKEFALFANNTDKAYSGDVSISDNTADTFAGCFVRIGNAGDADVVVTDNSVSNCGVDSDRYVYITGATGTPVIEDNTFVAVAQIGNTKYSTLAAAVAAAANGDTVVLLADCDENVTVDKALTFDFNGYNFSGFITPASGYTYMDGVVKKAVASGTTSTGTVTSGTVTATKAKMYRLATAGTSMTELFDVTKIEKTTVTGKLVNDVPAYVPNIYKINDATYYVEVAKADATFALKNNGAYAYLAPATGCADANAVITKFATAVVLDQYVAAAEDVECGDAIKGTKGAAIYMSGNDAYYADGSDWAYFKGEFVTYDKNTKVAYKEHKWDAKSIIVKATDVKGTKVPVTIECEDCEKTFSIVPSAKFDNTWVKGVNYTTDTAVDKYNTAAVKYYIVLENATYTGTYVPSVPSTDKVVQSADTFDAGIAMYVGMSVMAAAGSAVVIGKKKD